ncbi:TauD/TfdA family dioxygenase [Pararhizobium sp. LjRoot235]|uniref:TauD/TfdA family dioxygenase n=1 Tax=Pararhizobium sp. LjRoot235 TaxID=3342291 RepID=UPI003ECF4AE4
MIFGTCYECNVLGTLAARTRAHGIATLGRETASDIGTVTEALGHRLFDTEIRLKNDAKGIVNLPQEIPFHCDYPKAEFVVWQCLNPGSKPAPLLLKDGLAVLAHMTNDEIDALSSIKMIYKCRIEEALLMSPIVYSDGNRRFNLTYNPWSLQRNLTPSQQFALDRFVGLLRDQAFLEAHFAEGDFLIIDNRRILHARSALHPRSDRFLMRRMISGAAGYPPAEVVRAVS